MPFSKLLSRGGTLRASRLTPSSLCRLCGGAGLLRATTALREELRHCPPDAEPMALDALPRVLPAGQVASGRLITYNGLVLLRFADFSGTQEAEEAKARAAELPHTLMTGLEADGRSVWVLARAVRPDGSLPALPAHIAAFHAEAYALAALLYCPHVAPSVHPAPCAEEVCFPSQPSVQRYGAVPTATFRPGFDAEVFHRPAARPLVVDAEEHPNLHLKRARKAGVLGEWSADEERTGRFYAAPDDEAPRETKETDTPCIVVSRHLSDFIEEHYRLRRNILKNEVEVCRQGESDFHPLNTPTLNSLVLEAMEGGLPVWDKDVKRYVQSDHVPAHNPLRHYLLHLPAWDGRDYIGELASRVPNNNALWAEGFRSWWLGMVAQWMGCESDYGNALAPLLIGAQGDGKSTFCRRLLPPQLADYYTDRIDLTNRRASELALTRFGLVNLDEFDQSGPSAQAFIKHLMQKSVVQTRRPYAGTEERMPRFASFIATTNALQPLCDVTGSRRFLCVELTGPIDNSLPIHHAGLYAQALHLLQHGAPTHLTHEQEAHLMTQNRPFQQSSPEEEYLSLTFARPSSGTTARVERLTPLQILHRLKQAHPHMPVDRHSSVRLAHLLQRNRFAHHRTATSVCYEVVQRK